MSSPTQREIDAPPYRLVINVQPKYRTGSPGEIEGYVARGIVTRLDGSPVYESSSTRFSTGKSSLIPNL
ncbi:hypothetical protein [Paraburkholderia sp. SIMBA_054]|uniref:hypothetical protein n=1 Tax=Paraburkholderia sp. SIMBA_054 TaxID=3085795 RepID=UPI00397B0C04